MIHLHRRFFSTTTLRHLKFQLISFHNPLISPPTVKLSNSAAAVQSRNRFPFRYFGVINNANILNSVTSVNGFSIPFPANGVGRSSSSSFSSAAASEKHKLKKTVKAAVHDKSVASSNKPAAEEAENVEIGKTGLTDESKIDKQDSKVNASKKKKKKSLQSKKKDVKVSAASDSSQVVDEKVSRKSSSKGKKTNLKESLSVSTSKEVHDESTSTRSKKKDVKSSHVDPEPPWKFTGKPLYPPVGKSVVVVESVTKANVIQRYLGDMYKVLPSYGHVRDLAARSGSVRPDDDFSMVWEVPSSAWTHLKSINVALNGAENLILASDPDREGETIAWHIIEMLQQQGALHDKIFLARVVFHEITEKAIKTALQAPREIDVNLVHAYLARRALDYLIGFNISPLLWRKLPGCQSAGRVQSAGSYRFFFCRLAFQIIVRGHPTMIQLREMVPNRVFLLGFVKRLSDGY